MGSARSSLLGPRTRGPRPPARELLDLPVPSLARRAWRMGALIPSLGTHSHAFGRADSMLWKEGNGCHQAMQPTLGPAFSLPHEPCGVWPKRLPLLRNGEPRDRCDADLAAGLSPSQRRDSSCSVGVKGSAVARLSESQNAAVRRTDLPTESRRSLSRSPAHPS